MIILGIDPGLANTGWGIVEAQGNRFRCLAYGCISTEPAEPTAQRLAQVHTSLGSVIRKHAPAECAIEKLFFNANVRTAFATGQARGVALLATADARLPVGEYGPSRDQASRGRLRRRGQGAGAVHGAHDPRPRRGTEAGPRRRRARRRHLPRELARPAAAGRGGAMIAFLRGRVAGRTGRVLPARRRRRRLPASRWRRRRSPTCRREGEVVTILHVPAGARGRAVSLRLPRRSRPRAVRAAHHGVRRRPEGRAVGAVRPRSPTRSWRRWRREDVARHQLRAGDRQEDRAADDRRAEGQARGRGFGRRVRAAGQRGATATAAHAEARDALLAMGFAPAEASAAVAGFEPQDGRKPATQDVLRFALKRLGSAVVTDWERHGGAGAARLGRLHARRRRDRPHAAAQASRRLPRASSA